MNNFIIKQLDLKPEDIEELSLDDENNITKICILLKQKYYNCPVCFKQTNKVKEYKTKTFVHQIFSTRDTTIIFKCRRYMCPHCGKSFNEKSPFGHSYSSISTVTLIGILNELKHYTATYTHIAKRYNISTSTVVNIFDNHVNVHRHKLQEVINIDEFYFNRHSKLKYAFMIIGFKNNLIIDYYRI